MSNATATAAARRKSRKGSRKGLIAVVVIAAAGIGYWQWSKAHAVDPNADKLQTAKVVRGELVESIAATGSITAQTGAQVKIGSQITGTIKRLFADVGTKVKAGDPIAILNLPDLDAQVRQAKANVDLAQTKLLQAQSGLGLINTQSNQGVLSAQAGVASSQAKLSSAQASLKLQTIQTPSDIRRAEAAVGTAKATLSTANSALQQVQASAKLQIATAQNSVSQSNATYNNASINLKRNEELLAKGYVAGSIVDNAKEAATVAQAQLSSAKQNVQLVTEKVNADIQAAKDQVSQAQQSIASAQAGLDAANGEPFSNNVKQADVQDALNAVKQAQASLKNARANTVQNTLKQQDIMQASDAVKVAVATYQYNLAQQDKATIRSPISGTVLQLASQQGETLAAGLSSPTLIVVADLNRLQVDAYVDETDIAKVKLGQDASIVVDAFPKRPFKGKVQKVASGSTIQQGVVTYDVTISIADPQHRLKPDMTANVTLQTGKLTNVLLVPSIAVKVSTKGSTVNVLTKVDGKSVTNSHKVKTGGNDDTNTEIRDGVKEGDVVVLAGMDSGGGKGPGGPASPFGPSQNRGGGRGR